MQEKYRKKKKFYKGIRNYKLGYEAPTSVLNDKNGNPLVDKTAIIERIFCRFVELTNTYGASRTGNIFIAE